MVKDLIKKRTKTARIFTIWMIVSFALCILSYFFMLYLEFKIYYPLVMCINILVLVNIYVYYMLFHPFFSSIKLLENEDFDNVFEGFDFEKYKLPKSKIYYGKRAFFIKKTCVIIPYSQVAWIYFEGNFVVRTKDGRKFIFNVDLDEFLWLVDNFIIKYSPNVLKGEGDNKVNKKLYFMQNRKTINKRKFKPRIIWGSVLTTFGVFMLTIGLIKHTLTDFGVVLVLSLILGSGVLLMLMAILNANKKH